MEERLAASGLSLLRNAPILSALSDAEIAALAAAAELRSFTRGQEAIAHLNRDDSVFFVLEGAVMVSLSSAIGRHVPIRRLGPGDYFGEIAALTGAPRTAKVTAADATLLVECPGKVFIDTMNANAAFAGAVARELARKVAQLTDRVFELSALEVRFRLYAELLRLSRGGEAAPEGILIKNAPTHEAIAAAVGAQREVVTREFRALAEEGVIRRGKRQILVLDEARLRTLVQRRGGPTVSELMEWVY